jgi:glutaredoxin
MKKVELFYSPVCPHCPQARELMKIYKKKNPEINYIEVNTYTEVGIERGMSLRVMAVPCLAVNDEIKLTGWPFTLKDISNAIQ